MTELTAERARELLHYDPDTGQFLRRTTNGRWKAGEPAGCISRGVGRSRNGSLVVVRVDGRQWFAHRLAWLMQTGAMPTGQVDHRNGDPLDNRFANLRLATNTENSQNSRRRSRNTSGLKGASYHKPMGRWRATIQVRGVWKFLGYFDTAQQAHEAYCAAALDHFGAFARLD